VLVFRLAGQCLSENETPNKKNQFTEKFLNPEGLHVYKTNNDEIVATPGESNIRVSIASEKTQCLSMMIRFVPTRVKQQKHAAEY